MFGLLSDLDKSIWMDSPEPPPKDKTKMAGGTYNPWGIFKVTQEKDHIQYNLNSNTGVPNLGLLYGAKRNLLKEVGHCWMTFVPRKPGNVIAGIAIEDDWVILKPDTSFLTDLGEPEPEKEPVLVRSETIDMGIYGDLVHSKWDKKDEKIPLGKGRLGYHFMEVLNTTDAGPHTFMVSLGDDKGNSIKAKITEAQRNPFHAITKGYFKIVDGIIKGIMVENDWLEMYQ